MIEVTLLVMKPVALLWLLALNVVGFAFGFGAALALVVGVALACWLWWRYVVCRPSNVACGAFEWRQFGRREYYMEVA